MGIMFLRMKPVCLAKTKRPWKIYSHCLKVYRWIALGNLRRTNGKAFERKARGLIGGFVFDKVLQYKALLHPKTRKTLESATEKVIAAGTAQVLDFEMRPMAQALHKKFYGSM